MKFSRSTFHALAERELGRIPRRFLDLIHNLEIDVKDKPGAEAGKWSGSKTLLGLYKGLKRADMLSPLSGSYVPARIILYKENIEARCEDKVQLEDLVRTTLRHELAHHFGFSDEELRQKWPEGA